MAVTTEKEAEAQSGDNRTMGRKFTVPYGFVHGAWLCLGALAEQTGFSRRRYATVAGWADNMFEHDRSAARGEMTTRGLYVFKHEGKMGNAQAHSLFERIKATKNLRARHVIFLIMRWW